MQDFIFISAEFLSCWFGSIVPTKIMQAAYLISFPSTLTKSFVKMLNSIGPKAEPYAIPMKAFLELDKVINEHPQGTVVQPAVDLPMT